MFQRRAFSIVLSLALLAACGGSGESDSPADPPPITEMPPSSPPPPTPTPPASTNSAPVFVTEMEQSISENLPWTLDLVASDADNDDVTLTLLDSGDADHFMFDASSRTLTLRAPQDYERPMDADQDNLFEVTLTASDGEATTESKFELSITDQSEIFESGDSVLVLGATPFGGLGANALELGDIDQDGRPDIVLAAPGQHTRDNISVRPPAASNLGELFFISGASLSDTTTLSLAADELDGIFHLDGIEADLHAGYSMALIGDLDSDGRDDFAVARDETTIELISGATLADAMSNGIAASFEDLETGSITLPDNHYIDPHALTSAGDLNNDDVPDLAVCIRRGILNTSSRTMIVNVISGEALQDILKSGESRPLDAILDANLAGGFGRSGDVVYCGPITAIGDVDGDARMDLAIPTSEYSRPGATIYSGATMAEAMGSGMIVTSATVLRFDPPFVEYRDSGVPAIWADRVVTRMGDVSGDSVDDFGFSWQHFQDSSNLSLNAAFIAHGSAAALSPNGTDTEKNLRRLNTSGQATLLGAAAGAEKLTTLYAILPPEDGLHAPIILARYSEETLYSALPEDLPTGGTALLNLPISATGSIIVPERYRYNLSEVYSIGDLNRDGYGDLAIGYATASPFTEGSRRTEAGAVWLISGKSILDAREQAETIDPRRQNPIP